MGKIHDYCIDILRYLYIKQNENIKVREFSDLNDFKSELGCNNLKDNNFDLQVNRLIDMKIIKEHRNKLNSKRTYTITKNGIEYYLIMSNIKAKKAFKNWDDDSVTQIVLKPSQRTTDFVVKEKQLKVEVEKGSVILFLKGSSGYLHNILIKENEEPYIHDLSDYKSFYFGSRHGVWLYYSLS